MKNVIIIAIVGLFLFLGICSSAFCDPRGGHHHHFGGPRVFIDGYWGYPYYYPYWYYPYHYPYGYSYPYPYYPNADAEPPVSSGQEQEYYWYYCKDPQGYYPYVDHCPGGWMKVAPTPPQPGEKEKMVK